MQELQHQARAFQRLLGLPRLPRNGEEARAASAQLAAAVLGGGGGAAAGLLSQLVQEQLGAGAGVALPRARYIDVSTGMRLRYLEWGAGSPDTVLLLHDVGEAAEAWAPLADRLAGRGYHVLAVDLRGHGGSTRSGDCRYSAEVLADDVAALILALDLYARPLAVVGCGVGGAAALTLAQRCPGLVGAAVVAEFAPPAALLLRAADTGTAAGAVESAAAGAAAASAAAPELLRGRQTQQPAPAQQAACTGSSSSSSSSMPGSGSMSSAAGAGAAAAASVAPSSSAELAPWWGFHPAQGAGAFRSVEQCAALLAHPLANIPPTLLVPLAEAAAAAAGRGQLKGQQQQQQLKQQQEGEGGAQERPGAAVTAAGEAAAGVESEQAETQQQQQQQPQEPWGEQEEEEGEDPEEAAETLQLLLGTLHRPLPAAVADACTLLLQQPARGAAEAAWGGGPGAEGGLPPRMDPAFFFTFDPRGLAQRLPDLRCHLLLLYGGGAGAWVSAADAAATARAAADAGSAASAAAACLPGAGHRLLAARWEGLLAQVVGLLEGPAARCFDPGPAAAGGVRGGGDAAAAGRRPELLGLRPLPQFGSVEEARKALGPRAIPTRSEVEGELRRLALLEGESLTDSSDEESGQGGGGLRRYQTSLAKDPADYFGFVG